MEPIELFFDHFDTGFCVGIFYRMHREKPKTKIWYAHLCFDQGLHSATSDFEPDCPVLNPERYFVKMDLEFYDIDGNVKPFESFEQTVPFNKWVGIRPVRSSL